MVVHSDLDDLAKSSAHTWLEQAHYRLPCNLRYHHPHNQYPPALPVTTAAGVEVEVRHIHHSTFHS